MYEPIFFYYHLDSECVGIYEFNTFFSVVRSKNKYFDKDNII